MCYGGARLIMNIFCLHCFCCTPTLMHCLLLLLLLFLHCGSQHERGIVAFKSLGINPMLCIDVGWGLLYLFLLLNYYCRRVQRAT